MLARACHAQVEESDSAEAAAEEPDQYDFLQHFLPHTGGRRVTCGVRFCRLLSVPVHSP